MVVRMFAVGQPSFLPRPSPLTTSPSRSKGLPRSMLAASTRPSSTNSRILVEEQTRPLTLTGATRCSRAPRGVEERLVAEMHPVEVPDGQGAMGQPVDRLRQAGVDAHPGD